jgi:hypothetical protein
METENRLRWETTSFILWEITMEEIRYERNNGRTLEDDYLCETMGEMDIRRSL